MLSAGPEPEHLASPIEINILDLDSIEFMSDDAFAVYQDLAAYEDVPLNPRVEQKGESGESSIHEIVTVDAGYEGPRLILHLYLPLAGDPPYSAVIYFPGSSALQQETFSEAYWERLDYIPKSGRVLIRPMFIETYNRRSGGAPPSASEMHAKWAKDLGRTIDFLQTRSDINTDNLAYMGLSYGAFMAPYFCAIESRIEVAVLIGGGIALPDFGYVVPFIPRTTVPVLMLNGRYDSAFPVQTSQNPFFELLGTPPEHKRHKIFEDSGHLPLPRAEMISEILTWLDRYQSADAP